MPDCVLGLDGGGTKTHAVLLGRDRVVLSEGRGGPCSISAISVSEALAGVCLASEQACSQASKTWQDIGAVCVGVAGYSQHERRAEFLVGLQALFPGSLVSVEPDYRVALWGATGNGPGIIVIAGTGSVAYGENALGTHHRAGAYGYLIDDAGSGYGVGRAALAAVLRAADGTGEPTALTKALLDHLGMDSVADIVPAVYGGPLERVAIAGLASVVAEIANKAADPIAQAILMRTGGALARLTEAVAFRLFPDTSVSYPISPIGSLWNAGAVLTDVFDRSLARFAPSAALVPPRLSPAHGAALRAVDLNSGNVLQ